MCADRAGIREGCLAWRIVYSAKVQRSVHEFGRTGFADRLVATRKAKGVHRQLVADGASQLEGNVVLGQSAKKKR